MALRNLTVDEILLFLYDSKPVENFAKHDAISQGLEEPGSLDSITSLTDHCCHTRPNLIVELPNDPTKLSVFQIFERLFKTDKVSSDWFTPEFLAAGSINKLQIKIDRIKQELGSFESTIRLSEVYFLKFRKGVVLVKINLIPERKISELFLSSTQKNHQTGRCDRPSRPKTDRPSLAKLTILEGRTKSTAKAKASHEKVRRGGRPRKAKSSVLP